MLRLRQLKDFARLLVDRGKILANDRLHTILELSVLLFKRFDAFFQVDEVARFFLRTWWGDFSTVA